MFCIKCGEEIKENSKFCFRCGASQDGTISGDDKVVIQVNNEVIDSIITDGKKSLLMFASKTPFSGFNKSANMYVGGGILVIFILLYAFVLNMNIIQILNEVIGCFVTEVSGRYGSYVQLPNMQIEFTYDMFGKFMLIGIVCVVLDVAIAFLILYLRKVEFSLKLMVNNIAISYLPFIIGLVVNLIVGNFYVPFILGVYIACSIIHLIFLYKGIQSMLESETEPIWEYSIFIIVVAVIVSIMLFNSIDSSISMAFETLESYIKSMTSNILDSFKW